MAAFISQLGADHYPWRWSLEFDYNAEMIAALKRHIPSRQRKWKPEIKQWWFQDSQLASIEYLAELFCGGAVHERAHYRDRPTMPTKTVEAYRALHLLPSAPDELIKAAYRVMAKRCHPDAGGTTEQMQRVNEAYGKLTRK